METKPRGGYGGHAGTAWNVMWLIDKSVDGTVGQDQNCYFNQSSSSSFLTEIYSGMEQLVARWAHNPEVAGSNPASASSLTHH